MCSISLWGSKRFMVQPKRYVVLLFSFMKFIEKYTRDHLSIILLSISSAQSAAQLDLKRERESRFQIPTLSKRETTHFEMMHFSNSFFLESRDAATTSASACLLVHCPTTAAMPTASCTSFASIKESHRSMASLASNNKFKSSDVSILVVVVVVVASSAIPLRFSSSF
jgi:hypothetical protein